MERKQFFTTILSGGAVLAAAGVALGATPPPYASPNPYDNNSTGGCGQYHPRYPGGPNAATSPNPEAFLEHVDRHLGRLIEMLQRDPNDYSGHKAQAVGYLRQALGQIQAALGVSGNSANPIQTQP